MGVPAALEVVLAAAQGYGCRRGAEPLLREVIIGLPPLGIAALSLPNHVPA